MKHKPVRHILINQRQPEVSHYVTTLCGLRIPIFKKEDEMMTQEKTFVVVHDYVRGSVQAYPIVRRNRLPMCREIGVVKAATPTEALKLADAGRFTVEPARAVK